MRRKLGILTVLWVCCSVLILMCGAYAQTPSSQEQLIKGTESWTRVVSILGKNYLYYAQNSPEWAKMISEEHSSGHIRSFGGSGCVVTALAIATVNCLPVERMRKIADIAREPVQVDTRSLTRYRGYVKGRFAIRTLADTVRYWPLVLGNIAAGNNRLGHRNAQGPGFYSELLTGLGLVFAPVRDWKQALSAMEDGAIIITSVTGSGNPFSLSGHYMTMVRGNKEYLYLLDPYARDSYPNDKNRMITLLEPGVVRMRREDIQRAGLHSLYAIWPDQSAERWTKDRLDSLIRESNRVAGLSEGG